MNKDAISVIIPFVDKSDVTMRCLEVMKENSVGKLNVTVVDNCSSVNTFLDIWQALPKFKFNSYRYVHNPVNKGVLPALRSQLDRVKDELVLFMHNDVLIWEDRWDEKIKTIFDGDENLALAGFFGAPGVAADGGRMFACSNMLGKEWGGHWSEHGAQNKRLVAPATVLDSLAMIFRVPVLNDLGIPEEWPPHHWFDRLFCVYLIDHGYHVANLGFAFDHGGGTTSTGIVYDSFVKDWAERQKIETDNADLFMYNCGLRLFHEYANRMPLLVNEHFDYVWGRGI